MGFFDDVDVFGLGSETPAQVLAQVGQHCESCVLGRKVDKNNVGVCWAGSLDAKIAFLGDVPDIDATLLSKRLPVGGPVLQEFRKWIASIDLAEEDVLVLNTVQCKTLYGKTRTIEFDAPKKPVVQQCFSARALRFLRSLPNLEVVVTLGWIAGGALLGEEDVRPKTHEGQWFGSHLLPGVAIYCLDHPRELLKLQAKGRKDKTSQKAFYKKLGRLKVLLSFFRTEYLVTRKVVSLVTPKEGVVA